jgi:hypothetical protein
MRIRASRAACPGVRAVLGANPAGACEATRGVDLRLTALGRAARGGRVVRFRDASTAALQKAGSVGTSD